MVNSRKKDNKMSTHDDFLSLQESYDKMNEASHPIANSSHPIVKTILNAFKKAEKKVTGVSDVEIEHSGYINFQIWFSYKDEDGNEDPEAIDITVEKDMVIWQDISHKTELGKWDAPNLSQVVKKAIASVKAMLKNKKFAAMTEGEDKIAKFSKKFNQVEYWNSINTTTTVNANDLKHAKAIVKAAGVEQKLISEEARSKTPLDLVTRHSKRIDASLKAIQKANDSWKARVKNDPDSWGNASGEIVDADERLKDITQYFKEVK